MPGAGETGKSTLLKQMTMLLEGSFSIREREEVRKVILRNLARTCYLVSVEAKLSKEKYSDIAENKVSSLRTDNFRILPRTL